jgi:hypothetical protein
MRTKAKSWICLAGWLAGMACSLVAAEFAPPAEGPVAFRRDRIPLEADAMAGMSRQLGLLAGGLSGETPQERRGAAQMLALALALDPGNGDARKMLKDYKKNRHVAAGDGGRLGETRAEIRSVLAWLESPEAGADGQALADCLEDVIAVSESKISPAGEQGAWTGWIPDVSAYEEQKIAREEPPEGLAPAVEQPVKNPVLLEQAEIQTPLWQMIDKSDPPEWVIGLGSLQMTATELKRSKEEKRGFSIVIGDKPDHGPLDQLAASLKSLLESRFGGLPDGVRMQITSQEFESSLKSRRLQSISAATTVLASSAFTGREPAAIIIGQVDGSGAFSLPSRFWYQLQALGKGSGQRLVLPTEAAPYLTSILAMERPEFFFEYEVLLASDFNQLLDLTAKAADEPLGSASAKFREFRDRIGNQDLRSYIAKSIGKQRLAVILQDLPSHVSAKMLLIQASGNRPRWVSRKVLAAELRRTVEPMAWILKFDRFSSDSKEVERLRETYDICRAAVDGLERYAEKSDQELLGQVRDLVIELRSLDKAARSRGESYEVAAAMQSAHTSLVESYKEVIGLLATEVGDELPVLKE